MDTEGNQSRLDTLIEDYESSPIMKMIVAVITPLAIAEAGVLSTYKAIRRNRAGLFGQDLISLGLSTPTPEQEARREFAEALGATLGKVFETSKREKIRLFARLFADYANSGAPGGDAFDAFEEELSMLNELSYREFEILLLLRKYEQQYVPQPKDTTLSKSSSFWQKFQAEAKERFGLNALDLEAALQRISRTGLYLPITGAFFDYQGGQGYTPPTFERLLSHLGDYKV